MKSRPIIKNLTRPDKHPAILVAEFWSPSNDDHPSMVFILDLNCHFHMGILRERTLLHLAAGEGNCIQICRDAEAVGKWK